MAGTPCSCASEGRGRAEEEATAGAVVARRGERRGGGRGWRRPTREGGGGPHGGAGVGGWTAEKRENPRKEARDGSNRKMQQAIQRLLEAA
jgi:hypothetical protein